MLIKQMKNLKIEIKNIFIKKIWNIVFVDLHATINKHQRIYDYRFINYNYDSHLIKFQFYSDHCIYNSLIILF